MIVPSYAHHDPTSLQDVRSKIIIETITVWDDGDTFGAGELFLMAKGEFKDHTSSVFLAEEYGPYVANSGGTIAVNAILEEHEYCAPYKEAETRFVVVDIDGTTDPSEIPRKIPKYDMLLDKINTVDSSGEHQSFDLDLNVRVNYIVEHSEIATPWCIVNFLYGNLIPGFMFESPITSMLPGQITEISIPISNPSNERFSLDVQLGNPNLIVVDDESKVADFKPIDSKWFKSEILDKKLILEPNSQVDAKLMINLPENIEPGLYAYEVNLIDDDMIIFSDSSYLRITDEIPEPLEMGQPITFGEGVIIAMLDEIIENDKDDMGATNNGQDTELTTWVMMSTGILLILIYINRHYFD